MTHMLDTDHLSILLRQDGREWATVAGHIEGVGELSVGVSIVSFHEQVIGLHTKLIQARNPADLTRWYRKMSELLDVYTTMNVVPFDDLASRTLEGIRKAPKVRTKPMDLRIAAIALANQLTLVTRNTTDFELIEGLKLEDWTRIA